MSSRTLRILALAFIFESHLAFANLGNDSAPTPPSSGGYVDAAKGAATSALNSFNSQDNMASQAAGSGLTAGVYVNSTVAIQQFQRQYDAAMKCVGELEAALSGCITAANEEIAKAEAEKAACSGDESSEGKGQCEAAAQAKIDQAKANITACKAHISPMIGAAKQAASDVADAAKEAGFTMQASAGAGGNALVVQAPGKAVNPNAQVYVPAVKPIDTSTLDFWSTAANGNAYPGASPTVGDLIGKLEGSVANPAGAKTIQTAGLWGNVMAAGKVGFLLFGLTQSPSDLSIQSKFIEMQTRRVDLNSMYLLQLPETSN